MAVAAKGIAHTVLKASHLHCRLTADVLCRLSMSVCSLFLLLAAVIYGAGGFMARRGPDYRQTSQATDVGDTVTEPSGDSGHLPLLNEEQEASPI